MLLARIRQAQNRPEEARAIVDAMLSLALEIGDGAILSDARAFQAELALRQGRLAEASDWAAQSGSFQPVPLPYAFVPYDVQALILLAQDTPASRQQARELLSQMNDYTSAIHSTTIRIRVLALQAMLYSAEGDERQALAALSDSIALAAPGGFPTPLRRSGHGAETAVAETGAPGRGAGVHRRNPRGLWPGRSVAHCGATTHHRACPDTLGFYAADPS